MKFRKKLFEVEAVQWHPGVKHPGVKENPRGNPMLKGKYYVCTLNGFVPIVDGEWIITGVAGEFYPCKPDIFEQTYERVEP